MLGVNSKREPVSGKYTQEVRKYGTMPCVFSEDEMDVEIHLSELSGMITHEEVLENLKGRFYHENSLE